MSRIPHFMVVVALVAVFVPNMIKKSDGAESVTCYNANSKCFLQSVPCPAECPSVSPSSSTKKVCSLACDSRHCETQCKNKKPDCTGPGAACKDPRFIGGDGRVFYFHGRSNEHFTLVSDYNLQINARFIGLRPAGRPRDFTWIQALGIIFDTHVFSLEATKSITWDEQIDHLKFIHNGVEINLSQTQGSMWEAKNNEIKVERSSNKNSAIIYVPQVVEISINVVPVTKEDDRIHNYHIPSNDCFAHLEVQFRFYELSLQVEGVLGKTYQPDFVNPAKGGVDMPVIGGEDKYRTPSLLSTDCKSCIFNSANNYMKEESSMEIMRDFGALDCTQRSSTGSGILCKK